MSAFLGGWRLALRLARREAWRRKGQTILMLVLIGLPVLAVTAAAVVWQTAQIDGDELSDRRMGAAAALVQFEPDAARVTQRFDPENAWGWDDQAGEATDVRGLADVLDVLGGDRSAAPIERREWSFDTDHGEGWLTVTQVDLTDPLAEGLFRHVSGQLVPGPGEVVVNQALLDRGPRVGGTLTVGSEPDGLDLAIVGVTEGAHVREHPQAVVGPGTFIAVPDLTPRQAWLVGGAPVSWDDVRALNGIGAVVHSRAVLADPPPASELPEEWQWSSTDSNLMLTIAALITAMVLIEVVLLAGPAFAVRARQQAHVLALIGASGGTPTQARRVVLATSVVVGSVAGVFGAVLGIALGWVLLPAAQSVLWNWLGPFDVPWLIVAVVAMFGLASAVMAAAVPAAIAARRDIVAALAGRRGEGRPSLRSPLLGLLVLGGGIAVAVAGSHAQTDSGALLIALAAIVSVIGMILLVPVIVAAAGRMAARMPLPIRFSARDAARHRSRTVPAVAAVAATVAGVVALGIALSSDEAEYRGTYQPQLPMGWAVVADNYRGGDRDWDQVVATVEHHLPDAEIVLVEGLRGVDDIEIEISVGRGDYWRNTQDVFRASLIVSSDVPEVVEMSEAARADADVMLGAGGVVLLDGSGSRPPPGVMLDEGAVWEEPERPEVDEVVLVERRWGPGAEQDDEITHIVVPGTLVVVAEAWAPAQAIVPPAVAAELNGVVSPTALVLREGMDRAKEADLAEALRTLPGEMHLEVERGYEPDPMAVLIQWILAALGGVLMLGGTLTATFLALSDARPDLATMAAVGARPRTRRSVAAAYALVVGFVGAALGALVGFIPGLAITRPLTIGSGTHYIDIPWLMITAVVLGLPLLTAVVVGLFARSRLPMVARID